MDLDWTVTFLVLISALFSGVAAVRNRAWRWLGVTFANLGVVGLSWLLAPGKVAWVAGPFWLVTMIGPSLAIQASEKLSRRERFGAAMWLARIAAILHPSPVTRQRALIAEAQRCEQAGDLAAARVVLERLAAQPGGHMLATLLGLRLEQRWSDIRDWVTADPARGAFNPVAFSFWLRSLGETGARDALVEAWSTSARAKQNAPVESQLMLFTAAFGGRPNATREVLAAYHADMPEDARSAWLLTAAKCAGSEVDAELEALAKRARPRVALVIRQRISMPAQAPLSAEHEAVLDQLEREAATLEPLRAPRPLATHVAILVNLYVFLREIPGGTTNPSNLLKLGSLYTGDLDAWYRLATAATLHYGALHLVMNVVGLLVLGPALEAMVGRARWLAIYLLAALGGNALAVVWTARGHGRAAFLVGASGAVMGIAGALFVRRALRWRKRRTPVALRETLSLVGLFVAQFVFDSLMPQVAGSVHIFGALVGGVAALALGGRRGAPSTVLAHTGRARIGLSIVAVAVAGLLEIAWSNTTTAYVPSGVCSDEDAEACRLDCEALYGPLDAGTLGPPRISGARRTWLLRSCNRYAFALGELGAEEGYRVYAAGCAAGDTLACLNQGVMLSLGEGVAADPKAASVLYRRACDANQTRACTYLANNLLREGSASVSEIRSLFERACDAGDAPGCRDLERLKDIAP